MNRKIIVLSLILLLTGNLIGQDFSVYEKLVDQGKIEEVYDSFQILEEQYPNHPFIIYLKASQEEDGELAYEMFSSIVKKYPDTYSGEHASLKVAEYLYSKGLYTQTSEQLKVFPGKYPESKNSEQVFHLLKKSFSAIGEEDSISYYEGKFIETFPQANFFEYDIYSNIISNNGIASSNKRSKNNSQNDNNFWCIQVGAFGERKNADVIANRLKTAGYQVDVVEKMDRINLYLVQVLKYDSIEEAIDVGEELQEQFGLEFRVVQRH